MRGVVFLLAFPILSGCDGPAAQRQLLMEEIERSVRLPREAYPLRDYARHYTLIGPTKVTAVYVTQHATVDPDRIAGMIVGDSWRPLTPQEIVTMKAEKAAAEARWGTAGKRYWRDGTDDFPVMDDGGCEQVNILYDTAAKRFDYAMCNGGL